MAGSHRIGFFEVMDMTDLQLPHRVVLQERSSLTAEGVTEVLRFDDTAVVLRTQLGLLEIRGQELVLKALSPEGGQMAVTGRICGLDYEEPRDSAGFFRRLLK